MHSKGLSTVIVLLCLSVSVSICLFVSVSVCLSLSVCLSVHGQKNKYAVICSEKDTITTFKLIV